MPIIIDPDTKNLIIQGKLSNPHVRKSYLIVFDKDNELLEAKLSDQDIAAYQINCKTCKKGLDVSPSVSEYKYKSTSKILPPGTWLSLLIQVVTFGKIRPCTSCKSRASAMDRLGWIGCFDYLPKKVFKSILRII